MAEPKTKRNDSSVEAFLNSVANTQKRRDAFTVLELMRKITKAEPAMWGSSIVGFGAYRYKYASGRELEWPLTGFSPRQQSLTLYIMPGFTRYGELMKKLGKYKTGKSCLYIKTLDEIHLPTLETLVKESVQHMRKITKPKPQ
ncbi:MAG: hypothetical protein ALAOOOJD_03925 [bacterium]|nr:hypothetical protein [bacterium]